MSGPTPEPARLDAPPRRWLRWTVAATLLSAVVLFFALDLPQYFAWEQIRADLDRLQARVDDNLAIALPAFFLLYVAVTGLSLPVATVLSLVAGWLFGRWLGTALVSAASTLGATLAFLSSRYVLRAWVQRRFGDRLAKIDAGIARDGAYYLLTLRLMPIFPFFLVNLGMGLTPIRVWTYVWVSWLGMLPATFVYVNVGTEAANIASPADALSPGVIIALVLLGLVPLAARALLPRRA